MSGLRTTLALVAAACLLAPATLLADSQGRLKDPEASSARIGTGGQGRAVTSVTISTGSATAAPASRQASASATTSVAMGDNFFDPRDVAVSAGDTVRWVNEGAVPHTATGDGFDSAVLEEGQTFSHTFDSAGTFDYVCTLHPEMKGTVTVTGAPSSGNGSGGGFANPPGNSPGSSSQAPAPDLGSPPSAGVAPSGSDSSGGPLASTGLNLILIAEIGMCLLAGGALVRKLVRA